MFAFSIDGSLTETTKLSGAPASFKALFINLIVNSETSFALGCGLNTTEFPAAIIPILLHIIVSVGFVVGVIAPITPKGAYSTNVSPSSPAIASVVKSSIPGVLSIAN